MPFCYGLTGDHGDARCFFHPARTVGYPGTELLDVGRQAGECSLACGAAVDAMGDALYYWPPMTVV
jgi:hypothetical protein